MKKIKLLLLSPACLIAMITCAIAQEGRSGYFNNTKVGFIDVLSADYGGGFLSTVNGWHFTENLSAGVGQFQQQYGKETATTIASVVGNVLSGSVRNMETLEWLERIFGKVKQIGESLSIDRTKTSLSISERLEPLIPAGKIASLKAGEMVGMLASDAVEKYTGKFETSAINCRINLDLKAVKAEEEAYRELPVFYDFGGRRDEVLLQNFYRINAEVMEIVSRFKPPAPPRPQPKGKGSMRPGFKK